MLEQVEYAIKKLGPYNSGETVILACSGGADSTFLAYAWSKISQVKILPQPVIIIVNHLQPLSETNADCAAELYRGFNFKNVEVRAVSAEFLQGEQALREARYEILKNAARDYDASKIFLAHHADDQAETVLQRIMRGTGINGLAAMKPRHDLEGVASTGKDMLSLCRPLLGFRARDIREFLLGSGVNWIEDSTNQDVDYAVRNRIRKEIMPSLELIATGDPVKALNKLISEAQDWQNCVKEYLEEDRIFREEPSYLRRQRLRLIFLAKGETVSPKRLLDTENALLKKGSAIINQEWRFSISGGLLSVVSRT